MTEKNSLVSVIMPVFKVERFLDDSISSVLNQTYENFELILVDDCSPDKCGLICNRWAEKDKRVKVIHHSQNMGISAARNSAIDIAAGDYITFIDSDDSFEKTFLEITVDYIIKERADFIACKYYVERDEKSEIRSEKANIVDSHEFMKKVYNNMYLSTAWAKLYNKDLFSDLRYPVNRHFEDSYLILDIALRCNTIGLIDDTLYFYRKREDSIIHSQPKFADKTFFFNHHLQVLEKEQDNTELMFQAKKFFLHEFLNQKSEMSSEEKAEALKLIKKYKYDVVNSPYATIGQRMKYFLML